MTSVLFERPSRGFFVDEPDILVCGPLGEEPRQLRRLAGRQHEGAPPEPCVSDGQSHPVGGLPDHEGRVRQDEQVVVALKVQLECRRAGGEGGV